MTNLSDVLKKSTIDGVQSLSKGKAVSIGWMWVVMSQAMIGRNQIICSSGRRS